MREARHELERRLGEVVVGVGVVADVVVGGSDGGGKVDIPSFVNEA